MKNRLKAVLATLRAILGCLLRAYSKVRHVANDGLFVLNYTYVSVLVSILVTILVVYVDQMREAHRVLAQNLAFPEAFLARNMLFFRHLVGCIVLPFVLWYSARLLLDIFRPNDRDLATYRGFFVRNLPRFFGILPLLGLAGIYLSIALDGKTKASEVQFWLITNAIIAFFWPSLFLSSRFIACRFRRNLAST